MKAIFCHDNYYLNKDGATYSRGQFPSQLWPRYLKGIERVTVLGRNAQGTNQKCDIRSDLAKVDFQLFTNTNSLKGLFSSARRQMKSAIQSTVQEHDVVICRGVTEISWLAFKEARRQSKPIAVEMVNCPFDSLWHYGGFAAKLYAPLYFLRGRIMAKHADAITYVTKDALQKRYPSLATIQTVTSNVEIETVTTKTRSRTAPYKIGLIGHLDHQLKGIDTALKALSRLDKDYTLEIAGGGHANQWMEMAAKLGISERISFKGQLARGELFNWLDSLDIYIQPSRQEGVARASIEALSRGLPIIVSNAGGLPELVGNEWVFRKNHDAELACMIEKISKLNPEAFQSVLSANQETAKQYLQGALEPKRIAFWDAFYSYSARVTSKPSKSSLNRI